MAIAPIPFSPTERELIRREFGQRFGQDPARADGIFVRVWRTGPRAGQPRVAKALAGLIARGLVAVSPEPPSILGTRATFTPAGLEALRALLRDRRAMKPERFGHLRRELGLPVGLLLHQLEDGLAEGRDQLLRVDRADAADHAGAEVPLDVLQRGRRGRLQEGGPELQAVGAVVDPGAGGAE